MDKHILPMSLHLPVKGGRRSIGSWITISHPSVAEILANAGFDWLVVDMEHSSISITGAEELIRIIHLSGLPALVRVGEINSNILKRVMDAGASGVIVPMVNNAEQAKKAVAAIKYPPKGQRGVGLSRAQGYGTIFNEYRKWVNTSSAVIVQIEHILAVENIEDILNVEEVDGFIVGPYDLSASLGIPGEFDHPDMVAAFNVIKDTMQKGLKPGGFHVVMPDVELALNKLDEGYTFLAFGVDFTFLGEMIRSKLKHLRSKFNKTRLK